jgi:hypothetical protein
MRLDIQAPEKVKYVSGNYGTNQCMLHPKIQERTLENNMEGTTMG